MPTYSTRLLESERPRVPHLGVAEDEVRRAWAHSYGVVADRFLNPTFYGELADAGDDVLPVINQHLLQAAGHMLEQITPVFAHVSNVAKGEPLSVRPPSIVRVAGNSYLPSLSKAAPLQSPDPTSGSTWPGPIPAPRWRQRKPTLKFPLPRRKYRQLPALPGSREFHQGFDLVPPEHISAAEALPMDLIVNIDQGQRDGIRDAVTDAITHGYDPPLLGVQVANMVGLFPRWQRAVQNYHSGLLAQNMDPHLAMRQANRYADRLRRKRGVMIARTELMRAVNLGRLDQWQDQADKGYFDANLSEKVWSAAPDACPLCKAMDGVSVIGIDTVWVLPNDERVLTPPAHPHCRCTQAIRPRRSPAEN